MRRLLEDDFANVEHVSNVLSRGTLETCPTTF